VLLMVVASQMLVGDGGGDVLSISRRGGGVSTVFYDGYVSSVG